VELQLRLSRAPVDLQARLEPASAFPESTSDLVKAEVVSHTPAAVGRIIGVMHASRRLTTAQCQVRCTTRQGRTTDQNPFRNSAERTLL
jgi:hypothetical protein